MIGYLYWSTLKDILRPRRFAAWVIIVIILGLVGASVSRFFEGVTPQQAYGALSSSFIFRFLAIASAVFATGVIGAEIEQKTIVYLVTRPIERWKIYVMRTLASMTAVALLGIISSAVFTLTLLGPGGFGKLFMSNLMAVSLGAIAYVGLFTFITLLLVKGSMVVSMIYAFGWELMASNASSGANFVFTSIFGHMLASQRTTELEPNSPQHRHPSAVAGGHHLHRSRGSLVHSERIPAERRRGITALLGPLNVGVGVVRVDRLVVLDFDFVARNAVVLVEN
jgi:ABC-2 type transport system permease protein